MKLNGNTLIVATFALMACPWLVYIYHLCRYLGYQLRKPTQVSPDNNLKSDQLLATSFRWFKTCYLTSAAAVLIMLGLIFTLQHFDLLADPEGNYRVKPPAAKLPSPPTPTQ